MTPTIKSRATLLSTSSTRGVGSSPFPDARRPHPSQCVSTAALPRTFRPRAPRTDDVGIVGVALVAWSEKAAAHGLGLSRSTVKHHLANARSKVGAVTTAQLVWIFADK